MSHWKRTLFLHAVCVAALGCQADDPEPRFTTEAPRRSPLGEAIAHATQQVAQAPHTPPPTAVQAPAITRNPTSLDPLYGKFSLEDAVAGLPKEGELSASIETGYGTLTCKLFPDKAKRTVANFVGLARGLRPFWDGKAAAWVKRPLFDGTSFHRTLPDFMIQGGDHIGDGSGQVGYFIPDERVPNLIHDRAGLLCMANRGPNTNGGQFLITDAPALHLTRKGSYTIFGECGPVELIHRIANAPRPNRNSDRPEPVIPIVKVTISRR